MAYREKYITLDQYLGQYQGKNLYIGFVIGYGYCSTSGFAIQPPHMNGYSPSCGRLYGDDSHYITGRQQVEDRSPEAVKLSLRGLFVNGEAVITVKSGMTLSRLAALFNVTVGELVKWNSIENPNKIYVGQKIKIHKDNIPTAVTPTQGEVKELSEDITCGKCLDFQLKPRFNSTHHDLGLSPSNFIGPSLIILGSPLIPKHGGLAGGGKAGKWTSLASKGLRWTDRTVQGAFKTNVKFPAKGVIARFLGTRGIGAAAGRAIPYVGQAWTAWDVGWYLGENYGISKWGGFYRDYKKRKASEELIEAILEKYERENGNK